MKDALKLGVVMDPMESIHPHKDTTLGLLLEAQRAGFELYLMEARDLYLEYGIPSALTRSLQVFENDEHWFRSGVQSKQPLDQFDVILMRKDPPFNMEYIYCTYILEHAEQNGVLVVNKPQALRDANEKCFTAWFPQCIPPSLISAKISVLLDFIEHHQTVIVKPLDNMGGRGIFKIDAFDFNQRTLLEMMTQNETQHIMIQAYIPEIELGDKRIILIDGEPIPYALARIPKENEFRANLAQGGLGRGQELTERDEWICQQIAPTLKQKGLTFVGIDVIGDYLTEINVTSPTGIRELEREFDINIAKQLIDWIIDKLGSI